MRILFVCLGNICRSPMAEGLMRRRLELEGLEDQLELDSCGVGDYHAGDPPDPRARREAQRRGADIEALRARRLRRDDFERFDYLLCMDDSNLEALRAMAPPESRAHVGLLLDFAPSRGEREIDDPWFGGADNFTRVADQLEAACDGLLDHLRGQGRLH
nr:low molecular weight protein-tyrosine-phosphatase [Kushneria aurantia]